MLENISVLSNFKVLIILKFSYLKLVDAYEGV